jgi:hypothetical protein
MTRQLADGTAPCDGPASQPAGLGDATERAQAACDDRKVTLAPLFDESWPKVGNGTSSVTSYELLKSINACMALSSSSLQGVG